MKKVTFSDTDEVREYDPEDTPADLLPQDPAQQTSTGKRGRPRKPVELLSPLQLSEKRMKTAEETYHGEKDALVAKVIELKDSHAWLDRPSVVARLDERLDKRCRKVVALGMEWEDRKREWESERELEAAQMAAQVAKRESELSAKVAATATEAATAATEAATVASELVAEVSAHVETLKELQRVVEEQAEKLRVTCQEGRRRVLWLRGIL